MSIPIQINNKTFSCKKKFIQSNPSIGEYLLNGSYIINLDGIDIEPYQDLLSKIFLDQHYLISESDLNFLTQLNKKIKSVDLQIKIDKLGNKTHKTINNIANHTDLVSLVQLEELLLDLREGNFNTTCAAVEKMITERRLNKPTLIRTIFGSTFPCNDKIDIYIDLILRIDRNLEIKKEFCEKMVEFCEKSKGTFNREMCFVINKMIDRNLIEYNGFDKNNPFFMNYMNEKEINKLSKSRLSKELYLPEIKGDNFQHHCSWCKQGQNEHKIAELIRKDDIDQIKKNNFNFNNYDHLPPSIYECHEIFGLRAKHAEYAALYGAEKCFNFFMDTIKYTTTNDKLARCAIIGGNNSIIKKCIKLNLMTQNCLQTALIYHRNELFEWLIDQKKTYSISPSFFQISLFHGCFKAIQILIQHGVDPSSFIYNSIIHENASILHWNLLLDPDVNFKNGLLILKACETCKYDMLKLLFKYPSSDFNCRDKFTGSTCLHLACEFQDDIRVIKMILERMKKETIMAKQKDGKTALHSACIKGDVEVVKLIFDTGFFDIGSLTKSGHSSLYFAAFYKHNEVVNYFLTMHAQKVASFIDQKTIQLCHDLYDISISEKLFEITNFPPNNQTLSAACKKNAVEYVTYLFDMKNQKNWQFECKNKDFIIACKNGFSQIAHILIKNNIQLIPNEILNGKTSFHYACKNGMKDIVKILMNHDFIDVNLIAKRSKKAQYSNENEQDKIKFGFQEEYDDFSYDDEYDDENYQVSNEEEINKEEEEETSNTPKKKESNKIIKKKARKERRQKMNEFLKKSIVNLKDPFDQDTEDYLFNEESDEELIDKPKFDKFITEIRDKRKGRSPISIACRNGHFDIVMLLLQEKRIDLTDVNLLFDSIYSNNVDLVNCVLNFILEYNKSNPDRSLSFASADETPLQFVCRVSDNLEIVKLIYDRFPPVVDIEEFNSYYYSEYQKKKDKNYYISQANVFSNNFDFEYYSNENLNNLFRISIENCHPNTAKFILEKVIKMDDLHLLSDCLLIACKTPYKDIVRSITRSPMSSRLFEIDNLDEIISEICKKGRLENLKVIVKDLELDVGNMIINQTMNILHLASKSPNSEILEYVISMCNDSIDINLNEKDGDGYTALMLAAKKKNRRNTEILFFNPDVNRSIVAHKKSIVSLCYRTGEICFAEILRQMSSFNAKDENLVLHSISASGSVELLQWAIDNNVVSLEMMAKYLTKEGFNCLHTAVMYGRVKMIEKLVNLHLFDINVRANDGRTPLQIAVDSNDFKTVEFLLNSNVVALNAPYPKKKKTVLHKAVKEKMFGIVCLLLMNEKVDIKSKNSKGKTPEEICDSRRIQKMFDIRKSEVTEEEKKKKLKGLIEAIQKAEIIKEKYDKFLRMNRKIRFNYHVNSYEFDEPDNSVYENNHHNYQSDSSLSSDDDDDDEYADNMDNEIAFVVKKKKRNRNKRNRARYRNRKYFKKSIQKKLINEK